MIINAPLAFMHDHVFGNYTHFQGVSMIFEDLLQFLVVINFPIDVTTHVK